MSKDRTGEPAFPQTRTLPCGSHEECEGMTLRDYFAAKAMQAIIHDADLFWSEAAPLAYQYADAMLAARSKP